VWERIKKIAILKQLRTNLKAKHEKGVGTPFPPHYTPGHKSDEHSTAISRDAKTLEVMKNTISTFYNLRLAVPGFTSR